MTNKRYFQWWAFPTIDGKQTQLWCRTSNPPHREQVEVAALLPRKCASIRAAVQVANITRTVNEYLDDV